MSANTNNYSATGSSTPLARPRLNGLRSTSDHAKKRSKILLLGMRRSVLPWLCAAALSLTFCSRAGKSSILQVLFNEMLPKQTFYLETTMKITRIPIEFVGNSLLCKQLLTVLSVQSFRSRSGTPLAISPTSTSLGQSFRLSSSSLTSAYVHAHRTSDHPPDPSQDLYNQAVNLVAEVVEKCHQKNSDATFEVFVHKAEKLQEDDKLGEPVSSRGVASLTHISSENFRQIHDRVSDRLLDVSPDYEQTQLNFHLTSIYDHSLHEAFARVLHKLIDSLPYLEELLNVFCAVRFLLHLCKLCTH